MEEFLAPNESLKTQESEKKRPKLKDLEFIDKSISNFVAKDSYLAHLASKIKIRSKKINSISLEYSTKFPQSETNKTGLSPELAFYKSINCISSDNLQKKSSRHSTEEIIRSGIKFSLIQNALSEHPSKLKPSARRSTLTSKSIDRVDSLYERILNSIKFLIDIDKERSSDETNILKLLKQSQQDQDKSIRAGVEEINCLKPSLFKEIESKAFNMEKKNSSLKEKTKEKFKNESQSKKSLQQNKNFSFPFSHSPEVSSKFTNKKSSTPLSSINFLLENSQLSPSPLTSKLQNKSQSPPIPQVRTSILKNIRNKNQDMNLKERYYNFSSTTSPPKPILYEASNPFPSFVLAPSSPHDDANSLFESKNTSSTTITSEYEYNKMLINSSAECLLTDWNSEENFMDIFTENRLKLDSEEKNLSVKTNPHFGEQKQKDDNKQDDYTIHEISVPLVRVPEMISFFKKNEFSEGVENYDMGMVSKRTLPKTFSESKLGKTNWKEYQTKELQSSGSVKDILNFIDLNENKIKSYQSLGRDPNNHTPIGDNVGKKSKERKLTKQDKWNSESDIQKSDHHSHFTPLLLFPNEFETKDSNLKPDINFSKDLNDLKISSKPWDVGYYRTTWIANSSYSIGVGEESRSEIKDGELKREDERLIGDRHGGKDDKKNRMFARNSVHESVVDNVKNEASFIDFSISAEWIPIDEESSLRGHTCNLCEKYSRNPSCLKGSPSFPSNSLTSHTTQNASRMEGKKSEDTKSLAQNQSFEIHQTKEELNLLADGNKHLEEEEENKEKKKREKEIKVKVEKKVDYKDDSVIDEVLETDL